MGHGVPHIRPEQLSEENPYLGGLSARLKTGGLVLAAIGIAAAVGLGSAENDNWRHFMFSYLVAFVFFLSLSLGGLFFVIIQHLTRATWSVVVRRFAESLAGAIPLMAIAALPIVIPVLTGNAQLFEWADPAGVEHGLADLLARKQAYLNPAFWAARLAVYFIIWSLLGRYFLNTSVKQDKTGDPMLTRRMWQVSAPATVLFALTVTFFMVDMVMSLDFAWFSTIIGVYFFAGCAVGIFALLSLIVLWLQGTGRLTRTITEEHRHDLGKLMFAFLFFWAYIAFSQYMLIWYANIPEETGWYILRQSNGWMGFLIALAACHFAIPFLGLMPRGYKRMKSLLGFWAVWMLLVHLMDIYWLVMPQLDPVAPPIHLLDLLCLVGVGGLFVAFAAFTHGSHALVPLRDPRLEESLKFENV